MTWNFVYFFRKLIKFAIPEKFLKDYFFKNFKVATGVCFSNILIWKKIIITFSIILIIFISFYKTKHWYFRLIKHSTKTKKKNSS